MASGWRYRSGSFFGAISLAVIAVWIANIEAIQASFSLLPVIGHLPFNPARGSEFAFEAGTTAVVLVAALVPLYKPRPRRILDTAELASRRVLLACIALAGIGYFDYTYRLPRATLLVVSALLFLTVPAWFVAIRRRPRGADGRTVIVGDNPETMADILEAVDSDVIGYVSPPSAYFGSGEPRREIPASADGGTHERLDELACLGGLSRLDEVLVEYDIDTVALAFTHTDRAEFFGALDTCFDHGVAAKAHRDHADVVLLDGGASGELVDVDLEPWDPLDHVTKRLFDVAFSGVGLVVLSPVMLAIAVAIKFDDGGSVLYRQERTAAFGDTFRVYKFRSMVENAEADSGATISEEDDGRVDPRVTRVGRGLRDAHLDEIPQLWSIFKGDMSVVGPRPERPELDTDMESDTREWQRRWFVKPGLTGLAQINGATGYDPEEKLRFDIEYIRQQSFWFDLKIVVRQVWEITAELRHW
jgi:lipopolysaccharide/colanic/teichoic acid biosynthesis glycosyltransferase